MSERIIIKSDAEGNIKYELDGFAGDSCYAFTKKLESLMSEMGVEVESAKTKPVAARARTTNQERVHE